MKQKSFSLLIVILLCISNTSFPNVLPTTVGEGVWNVTTRIASELAGISLQSTSCNFSISQADIGDGGIFTITNNNALYCLEENITFTFGSAIVIAGSGITLDLNRRVIDGQNFATTGIELAGGVENITIKNGTITGMGGTSPNGVAIRDSANHTSELKNIIIKDMNFSSNNTAIDFTNASSPTSDVKNLLVENCRLFDSGNIAIIGASGFIQNCEIDESRGGSFAAGIDMSGTSSSIAQNFLIQDCITTTSFGSNDNHISVERAQNVIIKNCIIDGAPTDGVVISECGHLVISNCHVQGSDASGNGFIVQNPIDNGTVLIEQAQATGFETGFSFHLDPGSQPFYAVQLNDCIAQKNSGNGFIASQAGSVIWPNTILKNCSATSNGGNGFLIDLGLVGASLINIDFEQCTAQNNYGDGFSLVSSVTFVSTAGNVLFRDCISQNNYGGYYDPISTVTFPGNGFTVGTLQQNVSTIWFSSGLFLATYDVLSQTFTVVGNMGFEMFDIAFAPDGTLYGVGSDGISLYTINPDTAAATFVATETPPIFTNSLCASPYDGTLYSSAFGILFTIDPITGATELVRTVGPFSYGDIVFFNNQIYFAATDNLLYIIYPAPTRSQGLLTPVTFGLATLFVNGEYQLWGTSGSNISVYQIDPTDAVTTNTVILPSFGLGFTQGATSLVSTINNIIFENCVAQGNIKDGYFFAGLSANIQARDCLSMNNTGTGFNNLAPQGNNYITGCMATGNHHDFNGIDDPTQEISYNLPGAINGIGRFINVSS